MSWYTEIIRPDPRFNSTSVCRDLGLLWPPFRAAIENIIATAVKRGQDLRVSETFRSQARQEMLWRQGLTQRRTVGVHNYGLAADLVRYIDGAPIWKNPGVTYALVGSLGEAARLTWGGRWSFRDYTHLQAITVAEQPKLFAGLWYPSQLGAPTMPSYLLGCKPRTLASPVMPSWSTLRAVLGSTWQDPGDLDNMADLPRSIGMMLNDSVGDCVIAYGYHFLQLVTRMARGVEITEPDNLVGKTYTDVTGWDPNNPATDQGTDPAGYYAAMLNTGMNILPSPAGSPRVHHKFSAVVEIDYRNTQDVREGIEVCGGVGIAFNVPAYIMNDGAGQPRKTWDLDPSSDQTIVGGHMVLGGGFDKAFATRIGSWGEHDYVMTDAFRKQFGMGVWAAADPSWIELTGKTPFGMTLTELEAVMISFRSA